MPSFARNKGQRGEREVLLYLQQIVSRACIAAGVKNILIGRNLNQTRDGGCDVVGLEWAAIEVKRRERTEGVSGWWRQTLKQAEQMKKESGRTEVVPILMWRQNNRPWNIVVKVPIRTGGRDCKVHIHATVDMDWPTFLVWFEQRTKWEIAQTRDQIAE